MRNTRLLLSVLLSLLFSLYASVGWGQLQIYDDFTSYTTGSLGTQGSWANSGIGPDLTVTAPGTALTSSGYNGGGGNYIVAGTPSSNAKVYTKAFATGTLLGTNTIYYSLLLKVTACTITGQYVFAINDGGSNYIARLWTKLTATAGVYNLGVSTQATAVYGTTNLNVGTTYLVVLSYESISGSSNDKAKIWINPSLSSDLIANVTPEATQTSASDPTNTTYNTFLWRNLNSNTPAVQFDAIRLAYGASSSAAWTSLAAAAATPTITGASTTAAFSTTYGSASTAQGFSISGSNLTANIVATAPTGFQVSRDSSTYQDTVNYTPTSGSVTGRLHIRLKATAAVSGSYNSNTIALTSTGASTVNITTAASGNAVTTAAITITANNANKTFGSTQSSPVTGSTAYTITSGTLKNSETIGSVTLTYGAGATATTNAAGSTSTITPSAATGGTFTAGNYSINYAAGTLTVTAAPLTVTASNQSKNYGATAPTSGTLNTNYTVSGLQNSDAASGVTLGYSGSPAGNTASAAVGNYTITPSVLTLSTGNTANYNISYNTGTLTVNATTPSVPSITSITPGDQSLTVAFTAGSDGGTAITTYKYSTDGGTTFLTRQTGTTATSIIITTISSDGTTALSNGTAYNIQIKAVNAVGDGTATSSTSATPVAPSAPSASISGPVAEQNLNGYGLTLSLANETFNTATPTVGDFTLNNAPTGLSIGSVTYNSTTSVTLNLTYSGDFDANVTNFNVTVAAGILTLNGALTTNNITLTALAESISVGTVTAFGSQAVNTTSSEKSFTISGTVRGDISITPPSGYEISTGTGGSFAATNPINLSPTGTTVSSTTIYVRFKPTAVSAYSGNITASTTAASDATVALSGTGTSPANPSFSATASSSTQINLSATANSNSNNIVVVFNGTGTFSTPTDGVAAGSAGSSFVGGTIWYNGAAGSITNHTSLSANTQYFYKTYSYDAANFYSSGATSSATTAKAEPASQPTSLVFSSQSINSFNTAFTAASGSPDGYIVIRSTSSSLSASPVDGTTYTQGGSLGGGTIASVGATVSGISNASLSIGTTYYTFVFAYNNSGSIIDYNTTSPLTSSTSTLSAAPSPSATNVAAASFDITWTGVTGAASYQLDVTTDAGFTTPVSGYSGITATSPTTVTGLSPNTTYYFRVRAVNAGGNGAYGTGSQLTTAIGTPTAKSATNVVCDNFTANWSSVAGASSYRLDVGTNSSFLSASFTNVVSWDFPSNSADATADGGIAANSSKTISITGATGLNFPASGATTNSANATGWDGGGNGSKYWEVEFTTIGYYNTRISSKQRGSNTAPRDFKLQYKIGSGTYADVSGGTVPSVGNNYTAGVLTNLSLPSACDNQTSVSLRWVMTSNTSVNGSTVAASGSANIDDILVEGNATNYVSGYQDLTVGDTTKSVTGLTKGTTYYYRVRAFSTNSLSSNSNTITQATSDISITTSGTVAQACFNASAQTSSLSYSATTGSPTSYSIDWNAAANSAGLSDQNSTSLSFASGSGSITDININAGLVAGTYTGTMTITNASGCTATQAVSVTINPTSVGGTATPTASPVCSGSTTTVSVTGYTGTIQWQYYNGSSWGTVIGGSGATTATYTTPALSSAINYRALVTSGVCAAATSTEPSISITQAPTTSVAGSQQTICLGSTATLAANTPSVGTGAWTVTGPSTLGSQFSSTTDPAAVFTPAGGAGSYVLTWTISNSPCTASTSTVTITVNPTSVGGTATATATSLCSGGSTTITSAGVTGTRQWQSSADSSTWSNISGQTASTTSTGTLTSTTYYRVVVTSGVCASVTSTVASVGIYSLPSVTVTPSSATYCTPGGSAVSLTAGGASTYSWAPSTGLSATTGSSITASPTSTQTYTVTGTDVHGCVNTATTAITVSTSLTFNLATSSLNNFCSGGSTNLTATAFINSGINNYTFSSSSSGSLDDISTGATSLLTGNNDDVASIVTAIGFNFVYGGVSYSHYSVNSNGQLQFHTSSGASAIIGTNITAPAANTAYLFPMAGDNEVNGGIKYKLTGSTGNHKLVIEWNQFYIHYTPNLTNAGNMQVWLNEATGKIDFVYGEIYNASSSSTTKSIGLSTSNTATTAGYVTIGTSPTFTLASTFTTNNIAAGSGTTTGSPLVSNLGSSSNNSRITYSFTPPVPNYSWSPSTNLSATNISNPSASNVSAGITYTVTATSNGCSASQNVALTVNDNPTITGTLSGSSCYSAAGQNITIDYNGTTQSPTSYSIAWSGLTSQGSTSKSFNSGSGTISDISIPAGTTEGTYNGTMTITNGNGCTGTHAVTAIVNTNTWTGAISNSWNNTGNWSCSSIPDGTRDILISSGSPTLDVNLTLASGKTLTINGTGTLKVAPTKTLTIQGTANWNGKSVTFQSDNTGTAKLAQITGTLNGATNVTVERYVPAKGSRKYSFLASPVTQSVANSWQTQIHVTGPGTGGTSCQSGSSGSQPTTNSNGFDASGTNAPTMFYYDQTTTPKWNSIANTSVNLTPGTGYRVLVRGTRAQGCALLFTNPPTPNAVTLSATGTVAQGTFTVPVSGVNNGFTLLGNPYPADLNFTQFQSDNSGVIANKFWAYSPEKGAGVYATYVPSVGNANFSTGYANHQIIASGQAFFVENISTSNTVSFNEAQKAGTQQSGMFKNGADLDRIRVSLYDTSSATNSIDEALIDYSANGSLTYTQDYDARSMNSGKMVATMKASDKMAIQSRPTMTPATNDTVALFVDGTTANYNLGFTEHTNFIGDVYLLDKFNNTLQDIKATPNYAFAITADTNTKGANRFALVFKALPCKVKIKTVGGSTVCEPNAVQFVIDSNAAAFTNADLQWNLDGAPIAGETNDTYSINAASGGNVSLTISWTGCNKTSNNKSFIVKPQPTAEFIASGATTFCAGGSVTLTAPSISGYSYTWYNNGTSIGSGASKIIKTAGDYTVVAKLNGCSSTPSNTATVQVNPLPIASIAATTPTTFCAGDICTMNATPTGGTNYSWINGAITENTGSNASFTTNVAGKFKVIVTDNNGCVSKTSASSITTKVNPIPTATINAMSSTTISSTGNVKLNAMPSSGVSWQWYKDGTPIANATAKQYIATTGGNYSVAVTKTGCTGTSIPTVVTQTTSKQEIGTTNGSFVISAYPNPVSDLLTVDVSGIQNPTNPTVEIMNSMGQQVAVKALSSTVNCELSTTNWSSGIYFVRYKDDEGRTGTIKIIKD